MHGAEETKRLFPNVNPERLLGSVVYYDGQQNDSRSCLELGLTAAQHGTHVATYVEVIDLIKEKVVEGERIVGNL